MSFKSILIHWRKFMDQSMSMKIPNTAFQKFKRLLKRSRHWTILFWTLERPRIISMKLPKLQKHLRICLVQFTSLKILATNIQNSSKLLTLSKTLVVQFIWRKTLERIFSMRFYIKPQRFRIWLDQSTKIKMSLTATEKLHRLLRSCHLSLVLFIWMKTTRISSI